jgi:hypothetical protein
LCALQITMVQLILLSTASTWVGIIEHPLPSSSPPPPFPLSPPSPPPPPSLSSPVVILFSYKSPPSSLPPPPSKPPDPLRAKERMKGREEKSRKVSGRRQRRRHRRREKDLGCQIQFFAKLFLSMHPLCLISIQELYNPTYSPNHIWTPGHLDFKIYSM